MDGNIDLGAADRHAIGVYLKTQTATPDRAVTAPDPGAMKRGAAIFSDACTGCHLEGGVGQTRVFPPLAHNAMAQQTDPLGVEHIILGGTRIGTSATTPSPLSMPSFAWKLTDSEVADVATYVRNSWGNSAPAVSAGQVRDLRRKLGLDVRRYTANSGDQK